MDAKPQCGTPAAAAPAPRGLANIKAVGEFLSLSRISIYEHTRQGSLRAVRLGRAVRYDWAEVERAAREGLPALKKTAASPPAQANPEVEAPSPCQAAKRRPGRPRKPAAAPMLGQGGTPC